VRPGEAASAISAHPDTAAFAHQSILPMRSPLPHHPLQSRSSGYPWLAEPQDRVLANDNGSNGGVWKAGVGEERRPRAEGLP